MKYYSEYNQLLESIRINKIELDLRKSYGDHILEEGFLSDLVFKVKDKLSKIIPNKDDLKYWAKFLILKLNYNYKQLLKDIDDYKTKKRLESAGYHKSLPDMFGRKKDPVRLEAATFLLMNIIACWLNIKFFKYLKESGGIDAIIDFLDRHKDQVASLFN